MIIGQTIFPGTYYGMWRPCPGEAGVFGGEVIATSPAAATLVVYLQTKNRTEADSAAGTMTSGSLKWQNAIGVQSVAASGAKELVRPQYIVTSGGAGWVHTRELDTAWCRT